MFKLSKRTKTNLKIAVATATCVFTLATAFTATIAWFASNQKATTTGMSVRVAAGSAMKILSCYAVRYDGTNGAVAIDVSSGNESITMSEYDRIFIDRNVNTPLFLRMEISNFNSSNDLVVTIPSTGAFKTNNHVQPYLSNVVSAQFITGLKVGDDVVPDTYTWTTTDTNPVSSEDVVASYQGMLAHAAESDGIPFVQGNTKDDTISLTLDAENAFDENFIITKQDGTRVIVAFIVLDYYVTDTVNLVRSYLDSYGNAAHDISFQSDINKITVSNGDN